MLIVELGLPDEAAAGLGLERRIQTGRRGRAGLRPDLVRRHYQRDVGLVLTVGPAHFHYGR